MTIRPYRPEDFFLLQNWLSDPALLFTVAGPGWTYPISQEQIENHRQQYPFKQLYIGEENGVPLAMGEIIGREEHAPRLGRLLVGEKQKRGTGLGEKFIRLLIQECIRLYHSDSICLFVLEKNVSAMGLYKKIGFNLSDEKIPDMVYQGNPEKVLKMVMPLPH